MFSISFAIYLFVIATALGVLEIQIEGSHGWAEKLPCWRPKPDSCIARAWARAFSGKPLTGYHIAILVLILVILHFPFVICTSWTLLKELQVLSMFFFLCAYWDFLWFVWNPHYGLKRFKPEHIWWHSKWAGPIPTDYVTFIAVSLVLALIVMAFEGLVILVDWAVTLGILTGLTLISCLVSQLMLRKGKT